MKHTQADLDDAIEHIVYEMWKYRQSVVLYEATQCVGADAALEVRVLHHRVLLEFFHGPPKHENNILAGEFVPDWQCTHARAGVPWLDNYMTRCHTMLAHISTARSEMAKLGLKSWGREWQTVEPHLDQTVSDFMRALSTEHKALCLQWIGRFLACNQPGSEVLRELTEFVR